jgi:hypothetical protein
MTVYRVYKLREDGRVSGPPHVIVCRDDEAAMREAHGMLKDHAREVWDLARFVGKIEAEPKRIFSAQRSTKSETP